MSTDAAEPDIRHLLELEPNEVIKRYPDRARAIADRAREQGKPAVAEAIEARVQLVLEGEL